MRIVLLGSIGLVSASFLLACGSDDTGGAPGEPVAGGGASGRAGAGGTTTAAKGGASGKGGSPSKGGAPGKGGGAGDEGNPEGGAAGEGGNGGEGGSGDAGSASAGKGGKGGAAGKASAGAGGTSSGKGGTSSGKGGTSSGAGGTSSGKGGKGGTGGASGTSGTKGGTGGVSLGNGGSAGGEGGGPGDPVGGNAGSGGMANGGAGGATGGSGGGFPTVPDSARAALGKTCVKNADCKGGTCLTDTGGGVNGASPAAGQCVIDCTAQAQGAAGPDSNVCGDGNLCLIITGTVAAPEEAICVRSCDVGSVFGPTPADFQAQIAVRCAGRLDMYCNPPGDGTAGYCAPLCQSNPDGDASLGGICPSALVCDPLGGYCVPPAQVEAFKKTGEPCTVGGDMRECKGVCLSTRTLPVGQKTGPGVCSDLCIYGLGLGSCEGEGACLFQLLTGGESLDLGGCAEKVAKDRDEDCAWQNGVFAFGFIIDQAGNKNTYCVSPNDCKSNEDCKLSCAIDADCGAADGKCVNKKCSIPVNKCYAFDAAQTTVASGCLDHQPKVGGATPVSP